ncbi:contact-dependent growth inhibition system immunity protein [Paludisphaera sp.]|uniref:contact-dependent growth inhibition system immunity protein n=1 Tax=Paludisphaera sp. TaxID=2017432 RepID=UPI00301E5559
MSTSAYPRLEQLFGAFMHQDWDAEGRDWPELVRNFGRGQPAAELTLAADELDRLLAESPDDSGLSDRLRRELGCYFDPNPDGNGPPIRAWLGSVADSLRQLAGRA